MCNSTETIRPNQSQLRCLLPVKSALYSRSSNSETLINAFQQTGSAAKMSNDAVALRCAKRGRRPQGDGYNLNRPPRSAVRQGVAVPRLFDKRRCRATNLFGHARFG